MRDKITVRRGVNNPNEITMHFVISPDLATVLYALFNHRYITNFMQKHGTSPGFDAKVRQALNNVGISGRMHDELCDLMKKYT